MPGRRQADEGGAIDGGPAGEAAARAICLRQLTAAPRTRAQLADALRRRNVPGDVIAVVLDRFADVGLIDDAAFAEAWVESRHHGRGLARRALAAELRQRGVAVDDVRTAVAAIGPDDELASARRLVARRLAATRGRPRQARIRQLAGVLARKGYPAGLAFQVVREALESERGDQAGADGAGFAAGWAETEPGADEELLTDPGGDDGGDDGWAG